MMQYKPMTYNARQFSKLPERQQDAIHAYVEQMVAESFAAQRKAFGEQLLDAFFMAAMLTLINNFGFGTLERKGQTPKLKRFVNGLISTMDEYGDTYDDAMIVAMRTHLRQLSVEYDGIANIRAAREHAEAAHD